MRVQIRPFTGTAADYAAAVDVVNAALPEYPDTVTQWKHNDSVREPRCRTERWLAECDGRVVGFGNYDQQAWMYDPHKFNVFVAVPADYQHSEQGVVAALYAQIVAALAPHEPISLRADVREDMTRMHDFYRERGYADDMRSWESRLDVGGFDPAPYADIAERVQAKGVEIVTLRELQQRDPDYRRKLYALELDLLRDVPHPEPKTPLSFAQYEQQVLDDPDLLFDGYFVALVDGAYAGESVLWANEGSPHDLYTGLTGVRREYRRRGIALALKLRAIAYAREQGFRTVRTWNEANNRPMLAINEQLGFAKQPAWINLVKRLKQEQQQ